MSGAGAGLIRSTLGSYLASEEINACISRHAGNWLMCFAPVVPVTDDQPAVKAVFRLFLQASISSHLLAMTRHKNQHRISDDLP